MTTDDIELCSGCGVAKKKGTQCENGACQLSKPITRQTAAPRKKFEPLPPMVAVLGDPRFKSCFDPD